MAKKRKSLTEADSGDGGSGARALGRFRVNHKKAYYLEAGEPMGKALDEIVGHLRQEGTNVTLWEKVSPKAEKDSPTDFFNLYNLNPMENIEFFLKKSECFIEFFCLKKEE